LTKMWSNLILCCLKWQITNENRTEMHWIIVINKRRKQEMKWIHRELSTLCLLLNVTRSKCPSKIVPFLKKINFFES
jgi:hypothetical protein